MDDQNLENLMQPKPEVLSANFDTPGLLVVCTEKNILLNSVSDLSLTAHLSGGPFILAAAFKDSVATVAASDIPPYTPYYLLLYNQMSRLCFKTIEFSSKILDVKATENYLVVSLEQKIIIYDTINFKPIFTITRKSSNGMISISSEYLAWSSDDQIGKLTVYSLLEMKEIKVLNVHNSAVQTFSISRDEKQIISASQKGTLIRIFDIENGIKVAEFRRGYTPNSVLKVDAAYGCASAASAKTIHYFDKDARHLSAPLTSEPLAIRLIQGGVIVVTSDGIATTFKADDALRPVGQGKVTPAVAMGLPRGPRRTTV